VNRKVEGGRFKVEGVCAKPKFLNPTAAEILFVCRSLEYSESTTKRLKRMAGLQPPMEK